MKKVASFILLVAGGLLCLFIIWLSTPTDAKEYYHPLECPLLFWEDGNLICAEEVDK